MCTKLHMPLFQKIASERGISDNKKEVTEAHKGEVFILFLVRL
jgi:hypothetical protein